MAAEVASKAWCAAMPMLSTYADLCDFLACVTHGIAIEAIPEARGTKLLYAAQVALSTLHPQPKTSKPGSG